MTRATLGLACGLLACATPLPLDAQARAVAAMTSAKVTRADVVIVCQPVDAEVFLDGFPIGACRDFGRQSDGLALGKTARRVEVKKAGFVPYSAVVEAGGARTVLEISLSSDATRGSE